MIDEWLPLLLLLNFIALIVLGTRIFHLSAREPLYRITVFFSFLTAILSFLEYEILRTPSDHAPVLLSCIHTVVAMGIVQTALLSAWIFAGLNFRWPSWLNWAILSPFGLVLLILSYVRLVFAEEVIASLVYQENTWQYLIARASFWDYLWLWWNILSIPLLLFFFYQAYRFAEAPRERRLKGILFSCLSLIAFLLLIGFVIAPFATNPRIYFSSLPISLAAFIMGWIYTNFRLFAITSGYAYENVINAMSNILILTDEHFVVQEVNPATLKALNIERKQIIGKRLRNLAISLNILDWKEIREEIVQLPPGRQVIKEFTILFRSKQISLIMTISAVYAKGTKKLGYVFVGIDHTQYKMVESMLVDYTQQLEQSNEELERFAYIASHDLKAPVRNIGAFLSLIEKRLADHPDLELHEFLRYARENSRHAYTLIQDVLEYSLFARQSGEPSEVSLKEVLHKIKLSLPPELLARETQITWGKLPRVIADPTQIRQLFRNLIENGLRYNQSTPRKINLQVTEEGAFFVFRISDNGIGIKKDYQKQIFDMFTRLHSQGEYPGTGIGLAICEKIVKAHGGSIWLESTPGQGTTFFFTLPQHPVPIQQSPPR